MCRTSFLTSLSDEAQHTFHCEDHVRYECWVGGWNNYCKWEEKKHTAKCVGIMTNNECLRTPVPPSSMLTCNIYSIRQGGAKTILFNLELGGVGVVSKLGAPIVLSNLMPATCNSCSIHCLANQSNIVHPFLQMQTRLAKTNHWKHRPNNLSTFSAHTNAPRRKTETMF